MVIFAELVLVLTALGIILLGINFLCWLAFRSWPSLMLSENERLQLDYLSRVETKLKSYIPEWFDIKASDWPEFAREYREAEIGAHIYEDFVEFKHPPYKGRFLNRHPAGFRLGRENGPWPVSPQHFNIFFFGGSTTLNVGPDWTCIPSYLQDALNRAATLSKPVRVYNFGRGAYFSSQERVLFQQLLLQGHVPDMVVFLDGVNDFYLFEGKTAWSDFLRSLTDEFNRQQHEEKRHRMIARPKWQRLEEFILGLPIMRAVQIAGRWLARRKPSPEQALYRPTPVSQEVLQAVIDRYLGNKRQIEALCRDLGIPAVFVWQPTPAYKYDLSHHIALNLHYGLGGHERSGTGYELMSRHLQARPQGENFIWLADIQENERRPLYLDNMHYTADFSRIIGEHIARALLDRGFLGAARA